MKGQVKSDLYCSNCGKQLSDKAVYCPWCGIPIVRHDEEGNIVCRYASPCIKEQSGQANDKRRRRQRNIKILIAVTILALFVSASISVWLVYSWAKDSINKEPHNQTAVSRAEESDRDKSVDPQIGFTPAEAEHSEMIPAQVNAVRACTGMWINDDSSCHTINVFKQDGQKISVEVTSVKLTADGSNVSAIDITKIEDILLVDGNGARYYTDSWGNEGTIFLNFLGDCLHVNYEVTKRGLGRWGIDTGAGIYHRSEM